jgi:hypothetical protein
MSANAVSRINISDPERSDLFGEIGSLPNLDNMLPIIGLVPVPCKITFFNSPGNSPFSFRTITFFGLGNTLKGAGNSWELAFIITSREIIRHPLNRKLWLIDIFSALSLFTFLKFIDNFQKVY